jgi:hypothetical protein
MKMVDRALLERYARNYAAADKNDPFAFNRAMTHIKNGIAVMHFWDGQNWKPGAYEAKDMGPDENGNTVWGSMARP